MERDVTNGRGWIVPGRYGQQDLAATRSAPGPDLGFAAAAALLPGLHWAAHRQAVGTGAGPVAGGFLAAVISRAFANR